MPEELVGLVFAQADLVAYVCDLGVGIYLVPSSLALLDSPEHRLALVVGKLCRHYALLPLVLLLTVRLPDRTAISPTDASLSIMRVQEHSECPWYTLRSRKPVRSPTYWCSPLLPYTSQAKCLRLRAGMRQDMVQHRTGRSFGKGASARRAASRRPSVVGRPAVTRKRAAMATSRRRRRPLFFYAVTVCVAGELAAIVVDIEALVLVFSLMGLFLCAVVFRAAKN
jgi:hypothetical protein